MKIFIMLSTILAFPAFCYETITITDREVHSYWDFNEEKMSYKSPTSVREVIDRHGGIIHFKFTFLIDVDGRPKNFTFISAEPKSAEVEKINLKKLYLFYRYKHKKNHKFKGATFVEADLHWWDPNSKIKPKPKSKLGTELKPKIEKH